VPEAVLTRLAVLQRQINIICGNPKTAFAGGLNAYTAAVMFGAVVGNISWHTTREDLQTLFSQFGEVEDAFIPQDRESGRPRGFAFVTMTSGSDTGNPKAERV